MMKSRKTWIVLAGLVAALLVTVTSASASHEQPRLVHPLTGQAPARTFVVNKTSDSGDNTNAAVGTLRRAMVDANNSAGLDAIVFDLPGSGVKTITVKNYFPDLTDNAGVIIDGTRSDDRIEIDGSQVINHHGISIASNNNVIKGLIVNGVQGGGTGIGLQAGSSNNLIIGNYLGTNVAGTGAKGNHSGIWIGPNANYNTIGGTNGVSPGGACTGDCNLLSGNLNHGIVVDHASHNRIVGNFVGVDVNGNSVLMNGDDGVLLGNADNTVVGGASAAERNVIAGNKAINVEVGDNGSHHNLVQGNFIGLNSAGTSKLANSGSGVLIDGGAHDNVLDGNVISGNPKFGVLVFLGASRNEIKNNRVGIAANGDSNQGNGQKGIEVQTNGNSITGNRVAFNGSDGIRVKNGTGNTIRFNQTFDNRTFGINLGADAFTPNDNGDGDGGPNNLQNFPSLSGASADGATLTIKGTLNSRPSGRYSLDLFYNPACDLTFNNAVGEGKEYLGSTDVTTDGNGNASFTLQVATALSSGVVTATATDSGGNTSEYSYCQQISNTPVAPSAPQLLSPSNGEAVTQNPPTLDWAPAAGASYYRVAIRDGGPKGPKVYVNKNLTATQYTPPALPAGKTYYWVVKACAGTACARSAWFSFSVP